MTKRSWRETLADQMPGDWAEEIDVFESEIALKKAGRMDDKVFAETRLRRGAYGQRYDNGLRNDGTGQKPLEFPTAATKGVDTVWDAPGMQRIKIPYGKLTVAQLECLTELAEEYSDAILHITTRQDIQLHFVHLEDTPDLQRRLAAVGITTREACGNSVRNVTACQFAGVCSTETFDVTPYAEATHLFMLGHPDVQDFGRKFKIAFSGCHAEPCGLVTFHDLGGIAKIRDGKRGFELVVGGGLGAVPVEAKVLMDFCPEEELLAVSQAVCRVFARLGERQSRARARIKFLVQKTGIEEFRKLVAEERSKLRTDPRWTAFLEDLHSTDETPVRPGGALPKAGQDGVTPEFLRFCENNLRPQAQDGYYTATVCLPLGDASVKQGFALADLAREFCGDAIRCTVEQNFAFRWLSGADALGFYRGLEAIGLADAESGTISDVTSCPGTDTCKLGISASRGLAGELRKRLSVVQNDLDPAVQKLRIKASGCFNSCSQHHVADLGFLGVSRNVKGRKVPHFNVVLGGKWSDNAGAYGLVITAVPSKNVPKAIEMITDRYVADREDGESFHDFVRRIGSKEIRTMLKPIAKPPSYEEDPSYYSDWRDPREYTIGDIGVGECAGEVVPFVEFGLSTAERELEEAQDAYDDGRFGQAHELLFKSMLTSAQALVRHLGPEVRDTADDIVEQFDTHLMKTKVFWDPYAKGKFGNYLIQLHETKRHESQEQELVHRSLDEARLFHEAAHACYERIVAAAQNADEQQTASKGGDA